MTRLERFRLAIVRQGFDGLRCTVVECGCNVHKGFAPCHGDNPTAAILEQCRGGYRENEHGDEITRPDKTCSQP